MPMKANFEKWHHKKTIIEFKIYLYKQSEYSIEYSSQNMRYQIREQIDFATILYNKDCIGKVKF
jgi:hypothetical protein